MSDTQKKGSNFLSLLSEAGMLHDQTHTLSSHLDSGQRTAYVGIDPTSDSLHVGHLTTLFLLKGWQRAGHRALVLLGGATALIGDPSGKKAERKLLSHGEVARHTRAIRTQIHKILGKETEVLNNRDWWKDLSWLEVLRRVGKHLPMGYLLAKDTVKSRLDTGISFAEFSYVLMQAYDFLYLYEKHGVSVQMGGSDQWGNITAGIELIRRCLNQTAEGFTMPLLTQKNGQKFGKTEKGNLWLDAQKTSPYQLFQYVRNVDDKDLPVWQRMVSLAGSDLPKRQVSVNEAKRDLALYLVSLLHGETDSSQVSLASQILFGAQHVSGMDAGPFRLLREEIPSARLRVKAQTVWQLLTDWTSETAQPQLFSSRAEARRTIRQGGLSVNHQRIQTERDELPAPYCQKYYLLRKGKKDFFLLESV